MAEATHDTDRQLSAARQPWQAPTAEVLPVSQTATGLTDGNDGAGQSSGS